MKKENFKWKINDEKFNLFWEDHWNQKGILKNSFHRLFALSNLKGVTLEIFVQLWECYDHDCSAFWSQNLRSWELEIVEDLDREIQNVS